MRRDVGVCELQQGRFDLTLLSFIDNVSKDRLMDQFKARVNIGPVDVRRADRVCEAIL